MLAVEYGWSEECILDQPYCKLEEYAYQIRLTRYFRQMDEFNIAVLASGESKADEIEQYFQTLIPKRYTTRDDVVEKVTPGSLDKLYIPESMKDA